MFTIKTYPRFLSNEIKATVLIALSGIFYGLLGFTGTKLLQQHYSLPTMLFWRFFIATLYMIAMSFITQPKKNSSKNNYRAVLIAFFCGVFFYSGGSGFYFMATPYTGTGLAMVIFFSFPMFVVLYEWLIHKQVINKQTFICLMAIIFGLILLSHAKTFHVNIRGIFLGVLAALSYASYIFYIKQISTKINSTSLTIYVCAGSALIFLIISLLKHDFSCPNSIQAWMYIFLISLLCTALPIQMLFSGLKFIKASNAAILSVLEPVTTLIIGVVFLSEQMTKIQVIGVIVILAGATFIQFANSSTIREDIN